MTAKTWRRWPSYAAGVLALTLLAGCSTSGTDDSNEAPAGEGRNAGAEDAGADGSGFGDEADDAAAAEGEGAADEAGDVDGQTLPEGRMIARDAQVEIAVEDVDVAAEAVRTTTVSADGWVTNEEIRPDGNTETYDGYATLVISVPSAVMDETLNDLGPIGRVTGSTITSLDVTADYTDTTARMETLEASIERLRGLMEDAAGIEDIVALERELAEREADLDALQAHAEGLETDVERSSITIDLVEVDPDEPLQTEEEPSTGFAAGLENGWQAFLGAITFLMTALGALLPFAVVALVVLVPVLWWRRRRAESRADRGRDAAGGKRGRDAAGGERGRDTTGRVTGSPDATADHGASQDQRPD